MRTFAFLLLLVVGFTGCNSGIDSNNKKTFDSNNSVKPFTTRDSVSKVPDSSGVTFPAEVKPNQQYAYVKNIIDSIGITFFETENIQLLTGDKALQVARQKGDAAYDKNSKKYYLPDGYYITKQKKMQVYALTADVKVSLVSNFYRTENKVRYNCS